MARQKKEKKDGQKMSPMVIFGIIVAAVVIIIALFIIFSPHGNYNQAPKTQPTPSGSSAQTLFSSTPYYKFAHLISTSNLSSAAKVALTGFKMSSTKNSNGSVSYVLARSGYPNLTYTVEPGDKLYMIDVYPTDDHTVTDTDYVPKDDTAVVVNAQGYVVQ